MAAAPDYNQISQAYFMRDREGKPIHMRRKRGLARNLMDRTEYYERLINAGDLIDPSEFADHTVPIDQYTMNAEEQRNAQSHNDKERRLLAELRRKVLLIEAIDDNHNRIIHLVNNLHFFNDEAVSFDLIWKNSPAYLNSPRKPLHGDLRVNRIAFLVEYRQAETAYINLQNDQIERILMQHILHGTQDLVPGVVSYLRE